MSLSGRLALATFGYRGGISGGGLGQNYYIAEEVELVQFVNAVDVAVEEISLSVSIPEVTVSVSVEYEGTEIQALEIEGAY